MRAIVVAFAAGLIAWAAAAEAQSPSNAFQTRDQARQQQNAQRYQQQQRSGTPLGGYNDSLGNAAPRGTDRPGYTSPQGGWNTRTWGDGDDSSTSGRRSRR